MSSARGASMALTKAPEVKHDQEQAPEATLTLREASALLGVDCDGC